MSLFNHFDKLISYVELQKAQGFSSLNYTSFRDEVEGKITALNEAATSLDQEQLAKAKFAVFCWIDETVQRSGWGEKSQWQQRLLQEQHFNTSNGGDTFFENIERFVDQDKDLIRVYFRCLVLGFRGKYYRTSDDEKLYQIKQHCAALMGVRNKEADDSGLVCPDLYAALDKETIDSTKMHPDKWHQHPSVKWLWPIGILLIVYMFCYAVLYFTVHNYINIIS